MFRQYPSIKFALSGTNRNKRHSRMFSQVFLEVDRSTDTVLKEMYTVNFEKLQVCFSEKIRPVPHFGYNGP